MTLTTREMIIGMISDDSKAVNGCRLRLNWDSYNLVELWDMHKYYYGELLIAINDDSSDYWDEYAQDARESEALFQAEAELWDSIKPTQWDDVADRLEGVC